MVLLLLLLLLLLRGGVGVGRYYYLIIILAIQPSDIPILGKPLEGFFQSRKVGNLNVVLFQNQDGTTGIVVVGWVGNKILVGIENAETYQTIAVAVAVLNNRVVVVVVVAALTGSIDSSKCLDSLIW
jgi:hypothetical protein